MDTKWAGLFDFPNPLYISLPCSFEFISHLLRRNSSREKPFHPPPPPPPHPLHPPPSQAMVKTRGGHSSSYKPRVRPSFPAPAAATLLLAVAQAAATIVCPAEPVVVAADIPVAPAPTTLIQRRYEMRVVPTPPSPPP